MPLDSCNLLLGKIYSRSLEKVSEYEERYSSETEGEKSMATQKDIYSKGDATQEVGR